MAVHPSVLFAALCSLLASVPVQAEDSVQRIERLASVVATSPYGNIARTQTTLLILCDKPGLSKALEQPKTQALLDLMMQKKVVWANGDTPEFLNVLTLTMSLSYVQGLSRVASDATGTGKAIKAALCQSATKDADSFLAGEKGPARKEPE